MPRFFENKSESNSNDSKHFYLYYFGNPRTQSYGYVKYRISNPSRKGREMDVKGPSPGLTSHGRPRAK
ncbi:uncharacterized 8.8 kDa protein in rps12-tRNA-val intergenic region [Phtheirospermum japonicum]|uniref:Uncharacterized 8.8 kDa protein in rps12-tRNA-val intergenic region n=1 Tax=Phtheirospermum japonicum TaxID=374723 RepID=A0A830D0F9_9LAMI|nr:uncharacterized 8.8 kDa protein in rps12-tRNA-val intergenic region [Phtheirospermum japonicum]